jgi:hypothetical protein
MIPVLRGPHLAGEPNQGVRGAGTSARAANQPLGNEDASDAG